VNTWEAADFPAYLRGLITSGMSGEEMMVLGIALGHGQDVADAVIAHYGGLEAVGNRYGDLQDEFRAVTGVALAPPATRRGFRGSATG
jgi:hypothetical protein